MQKQSFLANPLQFSKKDRLAFLVAAFILLLIAFIQCYRTTADLQWGDEPDFDRDISFVQGIFDGSFGKDPSTLGGYLWYPPLLFLIEALIVKITHLPIHLVVVRAGVYLNLLGPVLFYFMCAYLFNLKTALASLLSFLFLATGEILCSYAATYSPWLYPVCFAQFLFYLNIILTYKAVHTQKYYWFAILGASIGINFLGHAAPAFIIILILIFIQVTAIFRSLKQKEYQDIPKYLLQGVVTLIPFLVTASPLLLFAAGKYHFHFKNRMISQYVYDLFTHQNFLQLVKANLSVSFFISVVGFVWFYRKFQDSLIKKIILGWFFVALFMYSYTSVVPGLERKFDIVLPVTVPSFHYFFYMKAAQSVFFGFGLVFLVSPLVNWGINFFKLPIRQNEGFNYTNALFIVVVLACAFIYYPFYQKRYDFSYSREQSILKASQTPKIELYNYIVNHTAPDDVILADVDNALFPVMPTGRKLQAIHPTFSNPYLDFASRHAARNSMYSYLETGKPDSAQKLFRDYNVSFVLFSDQEPGMRLPSSPILDKVVYQNGTYTLCSVKK